MKWRMLVVPFISLFLAGSCRNVQHEPSMQVHAFSDSLIPEYAKGFRIYRNPSCTMISILHPWQDAGNIHFDYILSRHPEKLPRSLTDNQIVIKIPVRKIICMSTTHLSMISALGLDTCVCGLSGTRYVVNPDINRLIAEGRIVEVGYESTLNYEEIMRLNPDMILAYGVGPEVSLWYARIHDLGIKAVFNAEYLENSPLARAEWIRFIAEFFCVQDKADSLFRQTEENYGKWKKRAAEFHDNPVVMTGLPWKDSWNVPGNDSYTACLIRDAGGRYWWSELQGRENYPLSIEKGIQKASSATIWINAGVARSLSDIRNEDERLVQIAAFKTGRVYNNNARMGPGGGSDYWESGVIHPDLILRDLVAVFHPGSMSETDFYYYVHLK